MVLVSEILADAVIIFGTNDKTLLYNYINDSISLLQDKSQWNFMTGFCDLCAHEQCATLPRQIEYIMGMTINGIPAIPKDQMFSFHLNGPGDREFYADSKMRYTDLGFFPTHKELWHPTQLVAVLDTAEDNNKELWVFGEDINGKPARTFYKGEWREGYLVPTVYGLAFPSTTSPVFRTVTKVVKAKTVGRVRLCSIDYSTTSGQLIGVYDPDETIPQYRRIRFAIQNGPPCNGTRWIRIAFRRTTAKVANDYDTIFISKALPLKLAMKAVKAYMEPYGAGEGMQLEAQATRMLHEAQNNREPIIFSPMQVNTTGSISDQDDNMWYGE